MDKVRIGVVGLGFGANLVSTIRTMDDVQLVVVADNAPKSNRLGGKSLEEYAGANDAKAYTDGVEMMETEDLDAVAIAVSPKYREPLMAQAVDLGLPIFVEKPFARDMEQGARIASLCENHTAPIVVDFVMSHMPAVVKLRELMDNELGDGLLLNSDLVIGSAATKNHWKWHLDNGNGVINENTCHLFDTVRLLMGAPVTVYAEGGSYLGSPLEDGVAMTIRFKNGGSAVVTGGGISVAAMGQEPYLQVYTANGGARLTGTAHMFSTLKWATRQDTASQTLTWDQPPRNNISHYALRHFIDCLKSGEQPRDGVSAGMQALAVAMAVRESLQRKEPVDISELWR